MLISLCPTGGKVINPYYHYFHPRIMVLRITSVYLLILGLLIIAYWMITMFTGNYPEGITEMTYHVISELLMAVTCLLGGLTLWSRHRFGTMLSIGALAMLTYASLNAAGYFGQRTEWAAAGIFTALSIISACLLVVLLLWNSSNL